MNQLLLIDVPRDHASVREERAAAVTSLKAKFGIFTDGNGCKQGAGKWIAFCVPECCEALAGYLKGESKEPMDIFASYCRLMDEMGLIDEGATEFEAVSKCAARQPVERPGKEGL